VFACPTPEQLGLWKALISDRWISEGCRFIFPPLAPKIELTPISRFPDFVFRGALSIQVRVAE
jgi:hypothetical protein